jgi:hypothetical protein
MMQRLMFTLIAALALSGCATRVEYITPQIPIPPPPVLPTVSADELACLPDEAYEALAVRDALRKGYAEQLRDIIRAHNERQE